MSKEDLAPFVSPQNTEKSSTLLTRFRLGENILQAMSKAKLFDQDFLQEAQREWLNQFVKSQGMEGEEEDREALGNYWYNHVHRIINFYASHEEVALPSLEDIRVISIKELGRGGVERIGKRVVGKKHNPLIIIADIPYQNTYLQDMAKRWSFLPIDFAGAHVYFAALSSRYGYDFAIKANTFMLADEMVPRMKVKAKNFAMLDGSRIVPDDILGKNEIMAGNVYLDGGDISNFSRVDIQAERIIFGEAYIGEGTTLVSEFLSQEGGWNSARIIVGSDEWEKGRRNTRGDNYIAGNS